MNGGDRRPLARIAIAGLTAILIAAMWAGLAVGPSVHIAMGDVPRLLLRAIGTPPDQRSIEEIVLLAIRAPRVVMGVLVGAALASGGALLQSLFRNPLADPGLIGVSSGAAVGAVAAIALGGSLADITGLTASLSVPVAAFLGGLAATGILYLIATRGGRTSVAHMLLAGVALGAMAGAATGLLIYVSDDSQLRDITFWLMGGLGGATWRQLGFVAPPILLVLLALPALATGLDRLVLGEAAAGHLGTRVELLKRAIFVLTALAVGAAVAVSGIIGFVGLVVPQLIRLTIGSEHRMLLPAAALLGGTLLIGADMVCRTIVAPAELPLGIVTALMGAPFFLALLLRRRALVDL